MSAVARGDRVRTAPDQPRTRLNGASWLLSLAISLGADEVFFLALTWAAIRVGSPGQVGLVVAAAAVPRVAIMLVGGVLADRGGAKRIAMLSGSGRALLLVGAAAVAGLAPLRVWQLIVVALIIGALDGVFSPAVGSLPARIAPNHLLGRIAALRVVTQRLVLLAAGPLAGVLLTWWGTSGAFWAAGGLFAAAVGLLALLRLQSVPAVSDSGEGRQTRSGFLAEVAQGLTLVWHDPTLRWLLLLAAALNLGFTGPVNAGLPLLAAHRHWGAAGAGALLGGLGLGAAATGLTLFLIRRVPRAGLAILGAAAVEGVAIAAFAVTGTFATALVTVVVLGLASGLVASVVHALLLTTTPAAQLGKVMALLGLTLEATFPVSNAVFGVLGQGLGIKVGFLAGAAVLLVGTLCVATQPTIRALEMPSRPRGDSE